jgi:hypothetical protein
VKKIFWVVSIAMILAASAFAEQRVIVVNWTAASNGAVGDVSITGTDNSFLQGYGYYLHSIEVNPGTPAPTDNYRIQITNAAGRDLLGGKAADCDEANTEQFLPSGGSQPVHVTDLPLTLGIDQQSVNGAKGSVKIVFITDPLSPEAQINASDITIDNTDVVTGLGTLSTKTGEVQAEPTANTILGRLKSLEDGQTAIEGKIDDLLDTYTDGKAHVITDQTSVVGPAAGATFPVSGTFWQATQPVSASALPLPTGAATETTLAAVEDALDTAINTPLSSTTDSVTVALPSGASAHSRITLASANQVNVKSSAGTLYSIYVFNPTAVKQYLLLFDKATAPDQSACNANSDCPVLVFPIPTMADTNGDGIAPPLPVMGFAFANGIGYSVIGAACGEVATCVNETAAEAGLTVTLGYK